MYLWSAAEINLTQKLGPRVCLRPGLVGVPYGNTVGHYLYGVRSSLYICTV
jgi:hypothetical protein